MDPRLLTAQSARLIARHDLIFTDPAPLARILNSCFIQRLEPGDVLCRERETGDEMYFLLVGEIQVVKKDLVGQEHELAKIQAPSMFGHMSLIDGSPRSATCKAAEPSVVAILGRASYGRLIGDKGDMGAIFRHLLLAGMMQQLAFANDRIRGLISSSDDEVGERELMETSGALDGWSSDLTGE